MEEIEFPDGNMRSDGISNWPGKLSAILVWIIPGYIHYNEICTSSTAVRFISISVLSALGCNCFRSLWVKQLNYAFLTFDLVETSS